MREERECVRPLSGPLPKTAGLCWSLWGAVVPRWITHPSCRGWTGDRTSRYTVCILGPPSLENFLLIHFERRPAHSRDVSPLSPSLASHAPAHSPTRSRTEKRRTTPTAAGTYSAHTHTHTSLAPKSGASDLLAHWRPDLRPGSTKSFPAITLCPPSFDEWAIRFRYVR